ncbi:MAG: multicopper oxidase domain-containing protein [Trichloromonadaceae bacterium]
MAFIPRDLSTPFDPADLEQIAEFEGFAATVPTTTAMIDFANGVPVGTTRPFVPSADPEFEPPQAVTRADEARVTRMFTPGFLTGVIAGVDDMPTPDAVDPSPGATFFRKGLHDATLNVPGAGAVEMWSFQAELNRGVGVNIGTWPASTIRVVEGEIVHTIMGSRKGPHTIHHHGIEPTPANDGVGHLTFEVTGGNYAYQWRAAEAGTYFYHCHRNTVLHFEMGMYGMLIVDPPGGPPSTDGGSGRIYVGNDIQSYDVEAIWVADDIDARYRTLAVADGIQEVDTDGRSGFVRWLDPDNPNNLNPRNPRLNDFNPTYFVVSGQAAPAVSDGQNLIAAAGATLTLGQTLLVRALNASYCTTVWKFPTILQGLVTAQDARTLGRSRFGAYSEPFTLASIGHQFTFTTAQRYDILIDTAGVPPGQHLVEIEFRHWISNTLLRTVRVPVNVNSQA